MSSSSVEVIVTDNTIVEVTQVPSVNLTVTNPAPLTVEVATGGIQGATGPQGPTGATGSTGPTGPSPTFSGTVPVTALAPVGTPTASLTGTNPYTLNLSLPVAPLWRSGSGAPAGGSFNQGDWYQNTNIASGLGDVYEKTGASTWTLRYNIRGAAGAGNVSASAGTIGNVVSYAAADGSLIQDGGFAVSDIVRITQTQTISGSKTFSSAVSFSNSSARLATFTHTANGADGILLTDTAQIASPRLFFQNNQAAQDNAIYRTTGTLVISTGGTAGSSSGVSTFQFADNGNLTATNFLGGGAGITGVVHATGAESVAGAKTFSSTVTSTSAGATFTGGTGTVGGIPDGVGTLQTPQITQSTTSGIAAVGVHVNDGTNNRRAGLFVDQTNAIWGLSHTASSGNIPFVIRSASTTMMSMTTAGAATFASSVTATSFAGSGSTITGVVHDSGTETINGAKTFTSLVSVTQTGAANDTRTFVNTSVTGADGTLGGLTFSTFAYPSATAGNRYVALAAYDGLAYRPLVLNHNATGAGFGRVGIGLTAPTEALEVTGNVKVNGTSTSNAFVASGAGTVRLLSLTHTTSGPEGVLLTNTTVVSGASPRLFFQNDGGANGVYRNTTGLVITTGATPGSGSGTSTYSFSDGGTLVATAFSGSGAAVTGVVHTTGTETVAGAKTFTSNPLSQGTGTVTTLGQLPVAYALQSSTATANSGSEIQFKGTTLATDPLTAIYASVSAVVTSNGTAGTIGSIIFATKTVAADTTLTERMKISNTGAVTMQNGLAVTGAISSTTTITATTFAGSGSSITGVVHDSGAETVAGAKTFSTSPVLSSLTASTVLVLDGSKNIASSSVTGTELGYVSGVTSAIQTQMNLKAPLASPTFTGTVSGITAAMVGLGNVVNAAQVELTGAQTVAGAKTFSTAPILSSLTASTVLTLDGSKNVASSAVTTTELGYVSGVTSSIQTQLSGKASTTGGAREATAALSATTGTCTGDLSTASIFTVSPTGNITLAFSNVPATGTSCTLTVIITQSGTVRTVTMPSGTKWIGAPAPTQVASKVCIMTLMTVDAGTTWYASAGIET